jgi:HK97 family phage portal protein
LRFLFFPQSKIENRKSKILKMNLFGLNISFPNRKAKMETQKSMGATAWLRGDDVDAGALLSSAYEQVVWVYRAINVLAEQVANIPFLFSSGERGRENLITSGPLLDFYSHPHPHINRFQYWELRVIWLMLRGECFRVPIFEGRKLVRILMLDPGQVLHIVRDHELVGWSYTGSGPQGAAQSQVFLPEEVWFEKLPNPFNFWRGMSPLRVASVPARTDFAAASFMQGLIENNADLGVVVQSDQQLSPEQRVQIMTQLEQRKRRAGRADKPLLIWGGAKVVKPEISSADLEFLANRKFSRSEICAAFGVPEEIVTTTDKAKYDVMAGARLNFLENRVAPLCARLEAEEEVTVRSIDRQAVGWFDIDSVPLMQEARRTRLASAKTGFGMGIPFNELNRIFDLGFKRLPWGDIGYLPTNLQSIGMLSEAPKSK